MRLVAIADESGRPPSRPRIDRQAPNLLLMILAALLLHLLAVSAFLMKWSDSGAPIETPPISVELINEPPPPPPPPQEARETPMPPPPPSQQQFRQSGGDPNLAQGEAPDVARIDPTPSPAAPKTKPVDETVAPKAVTLTTPLPAIEPPARKPAPQTEAAPPARTSLQVTHQPQLGVGEGGGDLYLNQLTAHLEKFRAYPELARPMKLSGTAVYELLLRRNGDLVQVFLVRSSGAGILDQEGIAMIRRAAPFAPVIPEIRGDPVILSLVVPFDPKGG